ncbi:hypothetical protein, partial [Kitasatospora sp. NE20-6]|uniref:hypothetical protein n=1 Tax=Kitasatospora sp. NE20-6 TaxID=2859066 RepID=UPI0038B32FA3
MQTPRQPPDHHRRRHTTRHRHIHITTHEHQQLPSHQTLRPDHLTVKLRRTQRPVPDQEPPPTIGMHMHHHRIPHHRKPERRPQLHRTVIRK